MELRVRSHLDPVALLCVVLSAGVGWVLLFLGSPRRRPGLPLPPAPPPQRGAGGAQEGQQEGGRCNGHHQLDRRVGKGQVKLSIGWNTAFYKS